MGLRTRWSRLTAGSKLAAVALGLAVIALAARPYRSSEVTLDLDELAAVIDAEQDHIHADELASWIVAGRSDYRLIDIRTEAEFAGYHIPTAENIRLPALPRAALHADEKLVLYSEGGIHAAQAWMLLRARGLRSVYTVKGGLDAWKDEVLFPVLPAGATGEERARFERTAAVARFFGGAPRSAAAASPGGSAPTARRVAPTPVMPIVEAVPPATTSAPAAPKKKKEGC